MTTPDMITALDEIIAATQTMGSEYGHPRAASIAEDIKRTLQSQQQPPHAPGPLYTTVPEILWHMRDVASHMGNGDYLVARIDEALAAREIELENICGENRRLRAALTADQLAKSQQAPPEASPPFAGQQEAQQCAYTPGHDAAPAPGTAQTAQTLCPACGKEGMVGAECRHCGRIFYTPDRTVACPRCYGSGMVNSVQCTLCRGLGQVERVPPTDSETPPERHIDTPDELLELLAGISSLAQVEGLSLAQKASTMALLHVANSLQEITGYLALIEAGGQQARQGLHGPI